MGEWLFWCVSGESVEENANVVVRLLIRRPECLGPALRGEGGNGLLAAMEEAIKISEDLSRDGPSPTTEESRTLYAINTHRASFQCPVYMTNIPGIFPLQVLYCRKGSLDH